MTEGTSIEVRCFHDLAQAAPLREEMDALCREAERPDPFSTFAFYENFLDRDEFRHQDSGRQLWLLCAFESGRLIGYLALRRTERRILGVRTRRLEVLATHDSDRPRIVCRGGDGERVHDALIAYLVAREREWDSLQLVQQELSSPLVALPDLLPRYYGRRMAGRDNATIRIRWPDLRAFHASCGKKMRNNFGRLMRRLFAAGELSALRSAHPEALTRLFELYRFAEAHAWKATAGAAIARSAARVEYFHGLFDPRQPMRVSIGMLLLDGVPIAGLVDGWYGRRMFALETCYDARLSSMGPGRAMLLMGLREAIRGGAESYNLLSGFSYFKRHWQAEITPTVNVELYRPATIAFAKAWLGDLKRRVTSPGTSSGAFNPARREVDAPGSAADERPPVLASPGERARFTELVADVRSLPDCEFLDAAALAAVLPFEAGGSPAAAPGPALPRAFRPTADASREPVARAARDRVTEPRRPSFTPQVGLQSKKTERLAQEGLHGGLLEQAWSRRALALVRE